MKAVISAIAAVLVSTGALAADPAGPADKKDSGSLSSGAKEAAPSTKGQGENAPVGDPAEGNSTGQSGSETAAGIKKPMSSDPAPSNKK